MDQDHRPPLTEDHASKAKGLAWLIGACALGVFFATGLSPLAHAIPWKWEKGLSEAFNLADSQKACSNSIQTKRLLGDIIKRLYPIYPDDTDFSIDVEFVSDPIINAYATLGGKIFINSGLLGEAESPEELAGVLAHEIEHVHHRHIMERTLTHLFTAAGLSMMFGQHSSAANWANYFLNMDFTRTEEAQADEEGLRRLQSAHISNLGFSHFFERMEKSENLSIFMSDHPSSKSRYEMVAKFANDNSQELMSHEKWSILKNSCPNRLEEGNTP